MHLLKKVRHDLTKHLWHTYKNTVPHFQIIESALQKRKDHSIILDHFAIIDLPSQHSGISHLSQIFSALGYIVQGLDYLPEKQNDFLWMVETDAITQSATETLPQIVVADFRLHELPATVKQIIEKYTQEIPPSPLSEIQRLSGKTYLGDELAARQLLSLLIHYFSGRQWSLPTVKDFKTVQEANELLAWVLLFGRIPNHFTISAHLLNGFDSLQAFMDFVAKDLGLALNTQEGIIKGNSAMGIQQGSTLGVPTEIQLADGHLLLPGPFIEFVWRYFKVNDKKSTRWCDYYTGFIAQNANKVVESLYENSSCS